MVLSILLTKGIFSTSGFSIKICYQKQNEVIFAGSFCTKYPNDWDFHEQQVL